MEKGALFTLTCCILLCSPCSAANDTISEEDINGKQYVEDLEITLAFDYGNRTGVYSGSLKNNTPDGIGKFESKNEEGLPWIYIGEWENGHFNGLGTTVYDNGQIRLGTYTNDYLYGEGLLAIPNSTVYWGNFNQDNSTGQGMFLSTGERYIGEFEKGFYHGNGILYMENGNRYEGNFSNGQINGPGTYFTQSGERVEGTFQENETTGLLSGDGIYYTAENIEYPCRLSDGNLNIEGITPEITATTESSGSEANATKPEESGTVKSVEITNDNPTPVICDTATLSISIQRAYYNQGYYQIEFMVENKSNDSITFGMNNSDIDGFQISVGTSCNTIDAGKKGVIRFSIYEQDFTTYGIDDFKLWNSIFSTFPYESNENSVHLCIHKEVFMQNSNGDPIDSTSPNELKGQIDELKKENQALRAENASLKEALPKTNNTIATPSSSKRKVQVDFYSSVSKDVTGKWRLAVVNTDIPVENYLLSYYKNYFKSDDEIHAIINTNDSTTTSVSVLSGMFNVTVHKYIQGEENDAKILFGGDVISNEFYDMDTGKIITF